jgi:hypothetical protein
MRSILPCTIAIALLPSIEACSEPAGYSVVTGPADAYDLLVVDRKVLARNDTGFVSVRLSGNTATAVALDELHLGGGAKLIMAQRAFSSERNTRTPLDWTSAKTLVTTRSNNICAVAFEPSHALRPGYSLVLLDCADGRILQEVPIATRPTELVAAPGGGVLLATRDEESSQLALYESATALPRWTYESRPAAGDPVVVGDSALLLIGDDDVEAINLADGSRHTINVPQPDGFRIDAIGATDRPQEIAVASCLCTPNGEVVESKVSFVDLANMRRRLTLPLPKHFSALDLVIQEHRVILVGYTSKPSPRPRDLQLGPQ